MMNREPSAHRRNAIAKACRMLVAAACVATSVFAASPKPAEACFMIYTQIDDCNWVGDYLCSYHSDGSGGLYVARSGIVFSC